MVQDDNGIPGNAETRRVFLHSKWKQFQKSSTPEGTVDTKQYEHEKMDQLKFKSYSNFRGGVREFSGCAHSCDYM